MIKLYKNLHILWLLNFILLGINFLFLKITFFDILFFVLFFILTGYFLAQILESVIHLHNWFIFPIAYFILLFLLSFSSSVFIDFYKINDLLLFISLSFTGGIIFFFSFKFKNTKFIFNQDEENKEKNYIYLPKYLILSLPFLFIFAFWLLFIGRTGEYIITPWQVIPKIYIYVFLLLTFTVWLLLFSRLRIKLIILIIILHSFLLHAYLPIIYQTGFGGDKWRHLASETYLMKEKIYSPVLFGEPLRMMEIGPFKLPEVLIAGNKTSYGNQWGITIMLGKFLHIDIFWIDYLLLFFIWSLVLPLLFYQWGKLIYDKRNFIVIFTFLPAVFYTLQVFGAITIPVSLGGIFFLFILYLWLKSWREKNKSLLKLALLFSLLMYFGYVLYFILIWEVGLVVLTLFFVKNSKIQKTIILLLLLCFVVSLPFLEILMGYGSLKSNALSFSGILNNLADAFGIISGLVAFIPRPTHIDQGNWLYNQTRQTQSEASLFSLSSIPFIFTVFIWSMIFLGIEKLKTLKDKKVINFLAFSLFVLLGNYIISWYFMKGNHILARRLDLVIVFLLIIFLTFGLLYLLENIFLKLDINFKVWFLGMLLSLIVVSTYTSGPVLEVVTKNEVQAAKFVWKNIDKSKGKYCVVSNTWPLLALEYTSGREIIAGGFPVYLEYAQPERVKIFEGLIRKPNKNDWITQAFDVTKTNECWYMLEKRWVSDKVWNDNIKLFGNPNWQFGKVYVWQIKNKY